MRSRRVAQVAITNSLLLQLLTQDNVITAVRTRKGVPSDAAFIYSYTDDKSGTSYMVFEHPGFDIVELGGYIPNLPVEFMRYHGTEAIKLLLESDGE
jgi:hypothetical protein